MNIGFLVITYGNRYLENCIGSIRKYYEYPIFVIDNKEDSCLNIGNNDSQIYYVKNTTNSFELGAIWFGTHVFGDMVEKFIIIHNSMEIIEKIPSDIIEKDFVSFWKTISTDYSPTINWVEKKLCENNIQIEHDKIWYSVTGCCCIIKTLYLKNLVYLGYDKIYGIEKIQAVGTEILFGYLITNVLGISNESLFSKPLTYYLENPEKNKYIKKIASGQGLDIFFQKIYIEDIPVLFKIIGTAIKEPNDLNQCYIDLIHIVDTEENMDIQNFLLSCPNNTDFILNNKSFPILCSIRHRLFTKKYFPSYYQIEKQEILSGKKILY